MIFLIHYDRTSGRLIELRTFDYVDRGEAEQARLELEISLRRERLEREVVLLEAADEGELRKTHRRYFENLQNLATPTSQ